MGLALMGLLLAQGSNNPARSICATPCCGAWFVLTAPLNWWSRREALLFISLAELRRVLVGFAVLLSLLFHG